jgi:hypothetical protein
MDCPRPGLPFCLTLEVNSLIFSTMKSFFNFLMSLQTRFAHTGSTSGVNNLHPNYIAGFIDGEGSFNITALALGSP